MDIRPQKEIVRDSLLWEGAPPGFRRNLKISPYENFTVYLMRGKKCIVYEDFVKIKAFLRKNEAPKKKNLITAKKQATNFG